MTMRIVFIKDCKEGKEGTEHFIYRPEALKLCEKGDAVPGNLYEKILRKKAEKKAELEKIAAEKKAKEDAEKKAELLKKKEAEKTEKADLKKYKKSEKSVKK